MCPQWNTFFLGWIWKKTSSKHPWLELVHPTGELTTMTETPIWDLEKTKPSGDCRRKHRENPSLKERKMMNMIRHDSAWWTFRKVSVPFDSDPTCSGEGSGAQWSRFGAFGALGSLGGALGTWQLLQLSIRGVHLSHCKLGCHDMSETESPQKCHTHAQYIWYYI